MLKWGKVNSSAKELFVRAVKTKLLASAMVPAIMLICTPTLSAQTVTAKDSPICEKLTNRATDLLNHHQLQQALPLAESAIRQSRNCGRAYLQKGFVLANLDRPAEAIPFLRTGFKLKPVPKTLSQ